jgi:hypothetical protein
MVKDSQAANLMQHRLVKIEGLLFQFKSRIGWTVRAERDPIHGKVDPDDVRNFSRTGVVWSFLNATLIVSPPLASWLLAGMHDGWSPALELVWLAVKLLGSSMVRDTIAACFHIIWRISIGSLRNRLKAVRAGPCREGRNSFGSCWQSGWSRVIVSLLAIPVDLEPLTGKKFSADEL